MTCFAKLQATNYELYMVRGGGEDKVDAGPERDRRLKLFYVSFFPLHILVQTATPQHHKDPFVDSCCSFIRVMIGSLRSLEWTKNTAS